MAEKTIDINKLEFDTNATYVVGAYLQDFKEPVNMGVDRETGEVETIDLHRIILQTIAPADPSRWGITGITGSSCMEVKIPLDIAPMVFGKDGSNFDALGTVKELIGCKVRVDVGINAKNKAVIRSITLDK